MRPADELSRLAVVGERLSRGGKQRVISVRLDEAIPGRAATRGPRSWPSMSEVTVLGAVAALEIGVAAAAALSTAARGTLTATFTRSLYVTIGGHWICIGPPGLGSGPLNALCRFLTRRTGTQAGSSPTRRCASTQMRSMSAPVSSSR